MKDTKREVTDSVTDAWVRVVDLEHQWGEYDARMCFTRDEREGEKLWLELQEARRRLNTVREVARREIRGQG